jgi:hypothetical protein
MEMSMNKKRILKVSCFGFLTFVLACTSFLFVSSGSGRERAASLSGGGCAWCIVTSPDPGTTTNLVTGVVALSTSDIWAVGEEESSSSSGPSQTLTMHWDGSQWSVVASPTPGWGAYLYGVTAISAKNVWAVGDEYTSSGTLTLIEHWNGTAWSVVSSPNPASSTSNTLNSVTAISANDIWAVGVDSIVGAGKDGNSGGGSTGTLIEHWNGTVWSIVTGRNPSTSLNQLNSVAAVSTSNVWAVGYESDVKANRDKTLVEHWNGHTWSVVASPNVLSADGGLSSVTVISGHNLWAVGTSHNRNSGQINTLIEQWNGSKWSIVTSPNPSSFDNVLRSVSAVSAKDVWAVGVDFGTPNIGGNSGGGFDVTLVEHWNGTAWKVVSSSNSPSSNNNVLLAVTGVPGSASQAWAVGQYSFTNTRISQSLIEEHL